MKIIKNLRVSARTVVFASLGLAVVTALAGAALAAPPSAPPMTGHESGETVARWNRNAISVLLPTNPPELTRSLAMTHIAQHDAANAVRPKYERYAYHVTEDTGADPSAAAAVAAAEVLKHRRPAKAADIDALLAVDLATVSNPQRLQNSINVGQAAAAAIIALRANDGSTIAATPYTPGIEPGDYQPTAAIVLLPGWGNVTPFAMAAGNQFLGDGPSALTSAEYTAGYNEVKDYGSATSTVRTGDQTAEARFWIENPPTVFNRVAQREIINQDLDLWQAARGMAPDTGTDCLARGLMEGMDSRTVAVGAAVEAVRPLAGPVSIDGGMSRNPWFTRFLAGALGRDLLVSDEPECTALGTALLAAEGAGLAWNFPRRGQMVTAEPQPPEWAARFARARGLVQGYAHG